MHIMIKFKVDIELSISPGDKILQGIIIPYLTVDEDETNVKRTGGFGSTGKQVSMPYNEEKYDWFIIRKWSVQKNIDKEQSVVDAFPIVTYIPMNNTMVCKYNIDEADTMTIELAHSEFILFNMNVSEVVKISYQIEE